MKTTLLIQLHNKCISYLELIELAKDRKLYFSALIARHKITTFKNELELWPIGQPKIKDAENGLTRMNLVISRLEQRYRSLLGKINTHSIELKN